MPIGVTEDHGELHGAARRFLEGECPSAVPRELLDAESEDLPGFWRSLADLHWMGLAVDEEHGGVGYGIPELTVVAEELGRACAPGPFLPCVLAASLLEIGGNPNAAKTYLRGIASGQTVAAVSFAAGLTGEETPDGLVVSGSTRPVLSAHVADLLIAPVAANDETVWCVLDTADLDVVELPSLDLTRRVAAVDVKKAVVPDDRRLSALDTQTVRDLAAVLFGAEAVGVAQWCVDTAAAYARERHQFDRPIGQFQGVKHRCADMLARVELARAATWDAARATNDESGGFTAAVAAGLAFDAAVENAKDCIQVLGGIGFTWEHEAHMYLRRATALRGLLGSTGEWRIRAARLATVGSRRRLDVDLPPEADAYRREVTGFLATIEGKEPDEARPEMAKAGYLTPSWPTPWGATRIRWNSS